MLFPYLHFQSANLKRLLQIPSNLSQMKLVPYAFPHTRIKLKRDLKDTSVSGIRQTQNTQDISRNDYAHIIIIYDAN